MTEDMKKNFPTQGKATYLKYGKQANLSSKGQNMLSLGGVYAPSTNNKQAKLPIALQNMTQNQTQINTIALHLDNDFAGRNATKSITEQLGDRFIIRDEPPLYGKDCNDYLQHMIRRRCSRQMGRE